VSIEDILNLYEKNKEEPAIFMNETNEENLDEQNIKFPIIALGYDDIEIYGYEADKINNILKNLKSDIRLYAFDDLKFEELNLKKIQLKKQDYLRDAAIRKFRNVTVKTDIKKKNCEYENNIDNILLDENNLKRMLKRKRLNENREFDNINDLLNNLKSENKIDISKKKNRHKMKVNYNQNYLEYKKFSNYNNKDKENIFNSENNKNNFTSKRKNFNNNDNKNNVNKFFLRNGNYNNNFLQNNDLDLNSDNNNNEDFYKYNTFGFENKEHFNKLTYRKNKDKNNKIDDLKNNLENFFSESDIIIEPSEESTVNEIISNHKNNLNPKYTKYFEEETEIENILFKYKNTKKDFNNSNDTKTLNLNINKYFKDQGGLGIKSSIFENKIIKENGIIVNSCNNCFKREEDNTHRSSSEKFDINIINSENSSVKSNRLKLEFDTVKIGNDTIKVSDLPDKRQLRDRTKYNLNSDSKSICRNKNKRINIKDNNPYYCCNSVDSKINCHSNECNSEIDDFNTEIDDKYRYINGDKYIKSEFLEEKFYKLLMKEKENIKKDYTRKFKKQDLDWQTKMTHLLTNMDKLLDKKLEKLVKSGKLQSKERRENKKHENEDILNNQDPDKKKRRKNKKQKISNLEREALNLKINDIKNSIFFIRGFKNMFNIRGDREYNLDMYSLTYDEFNKLKDLVDKTILKLNKDEDNLKKGNKTNNQADYFDDAKSTLSNNLIINNNLNGAADKIKNILDDSVSPSSLSDSSDDNKSNFYNKIFLLMIIDYAYFII